MRAAELSICESLKHVSAMLAGVGKRDGVGYAGWFVASCKFSAWFKIARFWVPLGISSRTLIPRSSGFTWVRGCRAGGLPFREYRV